MRKMKGWQKGFLYGLLFTIVLAVIFTIVLIYMDFRLEKMGLPHMCFAFTEKTICSFEDAIYTRLGFSIVLILVFGLPVAIFGLLIGLLIDKTTLGR